MPKASQARRHDLAAGYQAPFSVLTSVSLAHPDQWLANDGGRFSVVRLNFFADVSNVSKPVAFMEGEPMPGGSQRQGSVPEALGVLDLPGLGRSLVTDELVSDLHAAVRKSGRGSLDETYGQLRDDVRSAVVAAAWRPGRQSAAVPFPVARKVAQHSIRVRDADSDRTLLIGERTVTLYLAYADYMHVTYKRKRLGRNLVRSKTPPYEDGRTAKLNEVEMDGFPFAAFKILEAESFGQPSDKCRAVTTDDIATVEFIDPPDALSTASERIRRKVVSLYRVSNAAFPVRKNIALQRDWTERDLAALPIGPDTVTVRASLLRD